MKKYQVIYADPPWQYNFSKSDSRKIENQYPTMKVEDICKMEIPSDINAVLYLWATSPKLLEALKVMEAWGFEYKSQAIWNKVIIGMGYWFRGQHEILLVGTKGKFSPPDQKLRIGSVITEKRGQHSKKPDIIRGFISSWYPDKDKIEIFARNKYAGWDVFGNEVVSDVVIETNREDPVFKAIVEDPLFKEIVEDHIEDLTKGKSVAWTDCEAQATGFQPCGKPNY